MKEELIKKYESLTITNDFIFGKVMEDMDICQELLSRIVGFDVGTLKDVNIQVSVKETIDGRGIRLDSLTEGMSNNRYSSEMQVKEEKYAGKRIRYYQGSLDITSLQEGYGYDKLPEIYMIFICMHDIVGDGRCKHEFVYRSKENPEKCLEDGSHRIIINIKGNNEKDISPELRELIAYMRNGVCESEFMTRLHDKVCKLRVSRKCREDFMRYTLEKQQIERDSRAEGRAEERMKNARAMRDVLARLGVTREVIMKEIMSELNISMDDLVVIMEEISME